jgi:two-component system, NtrC family, nitrogen regulation response regulator NtrX
MKIISSQSDAGPPQEEAGLVVASRAMTELLTMADGAAKSPAPVLTTGESGVGKDLVARYIHSHSGRRLAPFVPVNCAGLADTHLESELFGQVNGHMTEKGGKLWQAHRGTLFLDEVGDMVQRMQAWLIQFLENCEIRNFGSDPLPVDVRVVAATNRNLNELVGTSQFRGDLLYRLRVIHLHVPPLRERAEDVHALMGHFLAGHARGLSFTDDALRALSNYDWPGNVRELRNVIERLMIMVPGDTISAVDLGFLEQGASVGTDAPFPVERMSLHEARDRFERDFILRTLAEQQGNMSRTADVLGVERSNLYRKMRAFGIAPRRGDVEPEEEAV